VNGQTQDVRPAEPERVSSPDDRESWQRRVRAALPERLDHPLSPYALLIALVLVGSWLMIRVVFRGRGTPRAQTSEARAEIRQDPDLPTATASPAAGPLVSRDASVGRGPMAAREPTGLEQAIAGRFELPSLDLTDNWAERETPIDPTHGLSGLKPTPRGTGQPTSAEVQREVPDRSVVSSGLATVVRQQVDARLELASAYMDLGDEPRARQLLAQTLIDGDERQRTLAQRMLNKLVRDS
jgi:FimV-like protein